MDIRDILILSLSEKLFICSRLLTAAANRLSWDSDEVQNLVDKLRQSIILETYHAGIEAIREENPIVLAV